VSYEILIVFPISLDKAIIIQASLQLFGSFMTKNKIFALLITLVFSVFVLSACGGTIPTPTVTPEAPTLAPTELPPSATPIPPATKVWLVNPMYLSAAQVSQIHNLAEQSGLVLEQFPSLTAQELQNRSAEIKLIIVFPPDPGLVEWISAYPQITFIPVGIANLTASPNVYPILPDGLHPEWDAYLAGYLAASITDDSRIGVVTQASSADGAKRSEGFINGGVMFCGLCNPVYPPYEDYPLSIEINAGSQQTDWQPVIDSFLSKQVKTAYVDPGVATPELLLFMAQYGVKLISSTTPPLGLEPAWVAVIQTNYFIAIQTAWTDALAQNPAGSYPVDITVQPVDTTLVTEGKLLWLNRVISDLTSGYLIP
jgi:hypothetical protein